MDSVFLIFKLIGSGYAGLGFGRFIEWQEIKSASSQFGYLHISFSRFGSVQVPSPYFMGNKDEIYNAIDEYAPKDSPMRKIIKTT